MAWVWPVVPANFHIQQFGTRIFDGTRRYDPDGLRLGSIIHPQKGERVDLNAECRAPLAILNIQARSVIAQHMPKACWVGVCDRIVARVLVRLRGLADVWVHAQELPRLWVVVAIDYAAAPRAVTRSAAASLLRAREGAARGTTGAKSPAAPRLTRHCTHHACSGMLRGALVGRDLRARRLALEWIDALVDDLTDTMRPLEIRSLGRTLHHWRLEICAWHACHLSNGPTEAMNSLIKRIKRVAFGFSNFRNYRIRALLCAGKPDWSVLAGITPR